MLLLRDRRADLDAAGITPFGISRDSHWSRRSWAEALGLDGAVTLLSDWNGEATRAFGVAEDRRGMSDVPARSAFIVAGDTVRAAWMLGSELPDLDAVIAAASSHSL